MLILRCKQKALTCYEQIESLEKFNEKLLPTKENSFSEINNEQIPDKDYRHVQKVWNEFQINS